jgi:nitrate/nitrite transport system ATP-binding protein
VARTLAMQPKVLLMDEPLSALDALTRAQLQDEIADIWLTNKTTVIWITNDPDEAILVADKVIPLLPTSPATLGEPMLVDIERPRDRKAINHDARFKKLRTQLITTLLDAKGRTKVKSSVKLSLPDILPEDLNNLRSMEFQNRRGPKRRSDNHREEVEVAV